MPLSIAQPFNSISLKMLQNTFFMNAVTQYIHLGLALLAPEYNKTDILAAADMKKLNMDKNLIKY